MNLADERAVEHEPPQLLFGELDDLGVTAMHLVAGVGLSRPVPEFGETNARIVPGRLPQALRHQTQIGGRNRSRRFGAHRVKHALAKHRFRPGGLLSYPLRVIAPRRSFGAYPFRLE